MPTAKVNGIELAYESRGDSFPLVLAHGYMATKAMWGGQIAAFSERYRVVTYDVRGHGDSQSLPVDDTGYTMAQLVDDQRALMDHLGIKEAYVGGLSLGGMIAMRFALSHPSMVRALLLADTSPGMGTEGLWTQNRAIMEGMVRSQGVAALVRGLYGQRVTSAVASAGLPELSQGIRAFIDGLEQMDPDGFLGVGRAAGDAPSVLDRLPEIAAPVLIVTGEADFFRGASEEMHGKLPGARYVVIKNAAHGTCLWQPERFSSAVLDFLSDVEAGRPVAGSEER